MKTARIWTLLFGLVVATIAVPGTAQAASKYKGDWGGDTGQNQEVSFTVTSKGKVKKVVVGFHISDEGCGSTVEAFYRENPVKIENKAFKVKWDVYTFKGEFTSKKKAEGTLKVDNYENPFGCTGSVNTDWTAKKGADGGGGGGGGGDTHTLTVDKDGTGTGTVTSSPSGINCGSDCSQSYDEGTGVTLTATPTGDSVFVGWDDPGCPGTAPCDVVLDANMTVTATFDVEAISYEGSWAGTTSQGKELLFTVDATNKITYYKFGWNTGSCDATTEVQFNTGGVTITNGSFSHSTSSPNIASWTFAGSFSSETAASGTLNLSGGSTCPGGFSATWSATKA